MGPGNKGLGQKNEQTDKQNKSSSLPVSTGVSCANSHGGFNPETGIANVMKVEQGHQRTGVISTKLPLQQACYE